jgi:hypothetical protein
VLGVGRSRLHAWQRYALIVVDEVTLERRAAMRDSRC